jgi:MinD-like ATPase involved in chromosome partitioning or flagellar assembly
MTDHISMAGYLLTWLDVERLLKQHTALWSRMPQYISGVNCFADGMEIRHVPKSSHEVDEWLGKIFGRAFSRNPRAIQLRIGHTAYPIDFLEKQRTDSPPMEYTYPLWRDITYLPKDSDENKLGATRTSNSSQFRVPARFDGGPELVSFHSFKGGVGRTTALMTYVAACFRDTGPSAKKILVVDGDLEAPGVSFWLDDSNRPTVSFVQFLEALHYPPAGIDASLIFFAEELRKTSLSLGGLQRELFVLPAALDLTEIQDMPVFPEHLARNLDNPWQLSDHLHSLGKLLGADAVFIDLRAGLSELASPILFDPRIDHFFVSTVAPQSVLGMAEVLRHLYVNNHRFPEDWWQSARPTVILSLLTKELREAGYYKNALKTLNAAYPANDPLADSVQWVDAEFLSTLMSIGSIREALDSLLQDQRFYASASEWAAALYATPDPVDAPVMSIEGQTASSSRQESAKRLYEVCKVAEFADSSQTSPVLATEPLLNLGKHFSHDLPAVLMIGAKGSGKTFTFRQIVKAGCWQDFLEKLGFDRTKTKNAAIFPVLWSDNINDTPDGEIKSAQGKVLDLIKGNKKNLLSSSDVRKRIDFALKNPPDHWNEFWDELIATQLGFSKGGLAAVNEALIKKSVRTILVLDGIEDAFHNTDDNAACKAIQALLQLTNRVSELLNPHLGVLVFVRIDYVQAAIRQNAGQWLQRFEPFRLHWNPESFLRLAYMLSSQAKVYPSHKSPEELHLEELKTELERLWGKKLGNEKSKEAHSARWVYAALCDLKGNVQARDLVRFLKFAADEESKRTGQTWPDRLLAPESMRKAIPLCSDEKVKEATAEITSLKRWIDKMKQKKIRKLKVPFNATEAGLDVDLLNALQEIGVVYEDSDGNLGEDRLFLPEIYRHGLGFETSAAGRPRMQALLKKNIGIIPL